MKIRRCCILMIQPDEHLEVELELLLVGGDGLRVTQQLLAFAPHLEAPVPLQPDEIALLAAVPATPWTALDELLQAHPAAAIESLLGRGLLIGDDDAHRGMRDRDERLRATHWWPPSAVAHYFGRWNEVRSGESARQAGYRSMRDLAQKLGPPPPHTTHHGDRAQQVTLPRATGDAFDALLDARVTCRNFDQQRSVPLAQFAQLLQRTFSARGFVQVQSDNVVIKRTSPSGGGLHPTEAYLFVQNVQGIAPGIYHYQPLDHALEPIRLMPRAELRALALRAVAAQAYYADAHVLIVLATRFVRTNWKYRNHTKAYRVVVLDAGHLSQTLYLSATQAGLGCFVTGAINEVEIEQILGIDPLLEGPLAVCGFGPRDAQRSEIEFDPLGAIWDGHELRVEAT